MKVVIIGGGAAGASCATRLRRLDEQAEILILEKSPHNSVASCGLPYYVGSVIEDRADMIAATPLMFKKLFNIDVRLNTQIVAINRKDKTLLSDTGEVISYDKLVLAMGSSAKILPIAGLDNLAYFCLKTLEDADDIIEYIKYNNLKSALIIGAGFSGIELAENLVLRGIKTSVVDVGKHILPTLDEDMVVQLEKHMKENGVDLYLQSKIKKITGAGAVLEDEQLIAAQMVIFTAGTIPNVQIAVSCGLKISQGLVAVNEYMQTSDEDIYAAGDIANVKDFVIAAKKGAAMAGPANRQGRLIASHIKGLGYANKPTQGSGIIKVFEQTAAFTGVNEETLQKYKIDYQKMITWSMTNAGYYPNAQWLALKVMYDSQSGKIYGAQAVGQKDVDKRIDVIATIMRLNGTVEDLRDAELCYSPPYSNAKDAINLIGMAIENVRSGLVRPYFGTNFSDMFVLDVRSSDVYKQEHIAGAVNIPAGQLRDRINEIPRDKPIMIHCFRGYTSYVVARILVQHGFENITSYAGGWQQYKAQI